MKLHLSIFIVICSLSAFGQDTIAKEDYQKLAVELNSCVKTNFHLLTADWQKTISRPARKKHGLQKAFLDHMNENPDEAKVEIE